LYSTSHNPDDPLCSEKPEETSSMKKSRRIMWLCLGSGILLGLAFGLLIASGTRVSDPMPWGELILPWLTLAAVGSLAGVAIGAFWFPFAWVFLRRKRLRVATAALSLLAVPIILAFSSWFRDWVPLAVLASVVPGFVLVCGILRLVLRDVYEASGVCYNCGYNLTGNVSGVCPECGKRVGEVGSENARG